MRHGGIAVALTKSGVNCMRHKNRQSGYLLEIPLLMMVVGIVLAIILPLMPVMIRKIFLVIGAVVWIFGIYYMIVIPGWQPSDHSRLRYPLNLIVFIGIAALLAAAVLHYVWYG